MSGLFVAGAGTDVGKTYVTAALIRALRAARRDVEALKPLVSGFDVNDWTDSDPGRLLAALGRPLTLANLDAISPWRYAAPLAPDMAALREGRTVDLDAVIAFCRNRIAEAGEALTLVEGVGGVMSPVAEAATNLDWMAALAAPVILVSGSYLGAISHALTAAAAIRQRGLELRAVIVSESLEAGAPLAETAAAIARFAPTAPVMAAPRGAGGWEAAALANL